MFGSSTSYGENIAYGTATALDTLIGPIVDDAVPSRGHRDNIFAPEWRLMGAFTGYHSYYDTETVQDFSVDFFELGEEGA